MTDELLPKLRKIIDRKSIEEIYVSKLLVYRAIQTIEEYIADTLDPKTRTDRVKCKAKQEAYQDCINLLKELV